MFSSQKFPKGLFLFNLNRKWYCFALGDFSLHAKIVQPILGAQASCKENIKIFNIFFSPSFPFPFLFLLSAFFQAGQRNSSPFLSSSPGPANKPISYRAVAHPEGVRGGTFPPLDGSNGWHTMPFHRGQVPAGDLLSQLRPRRPELSTVVGEEAYLGRRVPVKP